MAVINSPIKNLRCYISHGFMGGPIHSRGLKAQMERCGYQTVWQAEAADIIVAHSAACWLLPGELKPRLLVLVGAALPQTDLHQTYVTANRNIWRSARAQHRLGRRMRWSLASFMYGLAHPVHNYRIVKLTSQPAAELPSFANSQVVFIANQLDPWPHSRALQKVLTRKAWAFISLPGSHENIWEEPEKYSEIVDHYAQLLA